MKILCATVWLLQLLMICLLLGQHHFGVLHPATIPFLLLLFLTAALVAWSCFLVARAVVWHRATMAMLLLSVATLLPLAPLMSSFAYAHRQWSKRQVPSGIRGTLAVMAGGSLMESQAKFFYTHRMESTHLVMYFDKLASPSVDLMTMDQHVTELESLMPHPLHSKIHWVRGPLLGQRHVSFLGLALGSDKSPDMTRFGTLDRHELAHAVLTQYRRPWADPPMLLHEGWAEAHSGWNQVILAKRAVAARSQNPDVQLRDVFSHENYHLDHGLAYSYGGAFVEYLLRTYSVEHFVEVYNRCSEGTWEREFDYIYAIRFSDLEANFWRDAEEFAAAGEPQEPPP